MVNNEKVLIIAEAGVNHNGSLGIAKQLIDLAAEAGVDIVKFQTAKLDSLVSKFAAMADYQKDNIGKEESQKDMLSKLLLSFESFNILSEYCKKKNVKFLSTPFDIESIYFLDGLVDIWKVPSGEITNYPYLCEIGKTKKSVILSTGMADMLEIQQAINVLKENGTPDVTLLQCTTEYPAPLDDVNLNVMKTLKDSFNCEVGYSDHTDGIEVSLAAVAMGAKVIEKHFTIDKSLPGPDHKASASPEELISLVEGIRKIERALGKSEKTPCEVELKNRVVVRKSIVAKKKIAENEEFTPDNITTKRPGNGLSPMLWNELIGKKATRAYDEDELIEL